MILLNCYLDKSVIESLFHIKTYKAPDGSTRHQYYTDKRIYPHAPFDAPIFVFVNCKPDSKTAYVLKINISPRLKISRISTATGGLTKMQIIASPDTEQVKPPITMYMAKKGLPLKPEEIRHFRDNFKWGYECRVLTQPDKIIAYFYTAPTEPFIKCQKCGKQLACLPHESPEEATARAGWREKTVSIRGVEETFYLCPKCQKE